MGTRARAGQVGVVHLCATAPTGHYATVAAAAAAPLLLMPEATQAAARHSALHYSVSFFAKFVFICHCSLIN